MTFLNCAPSCLTIVVLIANFRALCLFKKPRVEFFAFWPWFVHCQQGGESNAWKILLVAFGRCSNRIDMLWSTFSSMAVTQGGQTAWYLVWPAQTVWPAWWCGLTAWLSKLLFFGVHLFRWSLHLLRGSFHEFACVQGELCWFIALVVLLFVYRWRGALLASPVRSWSELCSQVILFLSCVWTFDHLWSLCCFVVDFSFIFH